MERTRERAKVQAVEKPVVKPVEPVKKPVSNAAAKADLETAKVETSTPFLDGLTGGAGIAAAQPGGTPITAAAHTAKLTDPDTSGVPKVDPATKTPSEKGDPTKEKPKDPAARADELLEKFKKGETDATAKGKDYAADIKDTAAAAKALRETMAKMKPEEAARFLEGKGGELLKHIKGGLNAAGSDKEADSLYKETVTQLLQAGEKDEATSKSLTDSLLKRSNLHRDSRFQSALVAGIKEGKGSMMAAHAALKSGVNSRMADQVSRAFNSVRNDYTSARSERVNQDKRMQPVTQGAKAAAKRPDLFDPDLLESDREKHKERYAGYREKEEKTAGVFAKSLKGQALLRKAKSTPGRAAFTNMYTKGAIATLHETRSGRQEAARAMLEAGKGKETWTTLAGRTRYGDEKKGIRQLIEKGAMEGVALTKAAGRGKDAANIARGAATALETNGDPKLVAALRKAAPALETQGDPAAYRRALLEAGNVKLDEKGRATTADGRFLERLGVFAGAGDEARTSEKAKTKGKLSPASAKAILDPLKKTTGTAKNINSVVNGTGNPDLDGIGAGLKVAGSIDKLLTGSKTFQEYFKASIEGVDGLGALSNLMKKDNVFAKISGSVGKGVGAMFDVLDMTDAVREGRTTDAIQSGVKVAMLAAGKFLGKRLTGVVGLAMDGIDLVQAIQLKTEQKKEARETMGPAAAKALGVNPKQAGDFAEWSIAGDGKNLDRLEAMAKRKGVEVKDLTKEVLSKDPVQRKLLLEALGKGRDPADEDGPEKERNAVRNEKVFDLIKGMKRPENMMDTAWEDHVRRYVKDLHKRENDAHRKKLRAERFGKS